MNSALASFAFRCPPAESEPGGGQSLLLSVPIEYRLADMNLV